MAVQTPLCGYENQLGCSADWLPMIHLPPPPVYSNDAAAVTLATDGFQCSPNQTLPTAPMFPHQDHDHQLLPFLGFHDLHRAMVVDVDDPLTAVTGDEAPSSSSSIYHGGTALNSCYASTCTQQSSSSMSWAAEVDFQRLEIELFLKVQSERLSFAIQEQRKQQMGLLLEKIESRAATILREKGQQLETTRSRRRELEEWLARAEAEKAVWEKAAKDEEATMMELIIMIQQAKQKQRLLLAISSSIKNGAETEAVDAESARECDSSSSPDMNSRRRGEAGAENEKWRGRCRGCNGGGACMVFLPCRHLCSCKSCEGILQLCPVCLSLKQGTIEVYLSLAG